jgi:SAM-dependent methyltransferase
VIFRGESLVEILAWIARRRAAGEPIAFSVLDPDRGAGHHAGERIGDAVHRPLRVWLDLAERLGLRLATPQPHDGLIDLRFEPLARAKPTRGGDPTERYGADSAFARIHKTEDPYFVLDLREALARVGPRATILDLGVNTGEELLLLPPAAITGIDHSESALAIARARFPAAQFLTADLNTTLPVGRFDLVICLGTLQSGALDDRALVRRVLQDHLAPGGAVIFGLPNCRYLDGEVEYGARMVNFTQPELGLLVKDLAFYRKYLQQHAMQVFVTGKHEILVTGVPSSE